MPITPENALRDLKNGKFAPLYFIASEEPYYTDLVANYIAENALTPAQREFDATLVYGKDTKTTAVMDMARRFPVGDRQLIVVREAQDLPDFGKKDVRKRFENFVQRPVPTTILVFAWKHKKFDFSTKLAKLLDEKGILVQGKKIYENKLPDWIEQYVRSKKARINGQATLLLSEYIGMDLSRMARELDKLLLNFQGQENVQINPEHIEKYIGISRQYNVFELQKALAERNRTKAWKITQAFLKNPQDHPLIPIVSALFNFFSKVLVVHEHQRGGANVNKFELAKVLGVPPFFVTDYMLAARNFNPQKTIRVIENIQHADLGSKGIAEPTNHTAILQELVSQILY